MTPIRLARTATEAEEWALVLAAAGIAHRIRTDEAGCTVLVPEAEEPRARAALDAYVDETRGAPDASVPAAASPRVAQALGIAVAALLLAFFAMTGPPAPRSRWYERGAASAGRIVSGEPWRAATALTLHIDAVHVAGNAVAIAVLLPAIARQLGVGPGLWLVLLAGVGGNVAAAMAQSPSHVAVGASTSVFGAIGVLAALRLSLPRTATRRGRKRWIVPATALLLLAMLGVSRNADVLAHAFGLASGGALGLAAGATLRRPLPASAEWALVALATLAIVACWRLALA